MLNILKPRQAWLVLWIICAAFICYHFSFVTEEMDIDDFPDSKELAHEAVKLVLPPSVPPALGLVPILSPFTTPSAAPYPELHIEPTEEVLDPPSVFVLRPPKSILLEVDRCAHRCNARAEELASEGEGEWEKEWEAEWKKDEEDHVEFEEKTRRAFGEKVGWADKYPKVRPQTLTLPSWSSTQSPMQNWPFKILQTDQFALPAILHLLFANHATAFPLLSERSADFIYLAIPTLATTLCFNRCPHGPNAHYDNHPLLLSVLEWIQMTVSELSTRRQYPSILMSLALIDHDYEKTFMKRQMQEVYLDSNVIVMGIEREPWDTKDLLREKGRWRTLPYPSGLHLSEGNSAWEETKVEEWQEQQLDKRVFLLSFAGKREPNNPNSGRGPHNGFAIRHSLTDYFDSVPTFNATHFSDPHSDTESPTPDSSIYFQTFTPGSRKSDIVAVHLSMATSIFCLEPAGDSPTRKGFYESILLGCIPVIFRKDTYSDVFSGLLPWSGGLEEVAVLVDEASLLSSPTLDVNIVSLLQSISQEERKEKQEMIKEVARTVQWGLPKEGEKGKEGEDAFGMVLKGLRKVMEEGIAD